MSFCYMGCECLHDRIPKFQHCRGCAEPPKNVSPMHSLQEVRYEDGDDFSDDDNHIIMTMVIVVIVTLLLLMMMMEWW